MRRAFAILFVALLSGLAVYFWRAAHRSERQEISNSAANAQHRNTLIRAALLKELQPVKLANCELQRFGEANDGGYLLCGNLLGDVKAGYSYGISGYDGWGCEISRKLTVRVHEYDCFDLTRPICQGGYTVFHGECVAGSASTDKDGRVFDTPEHQIARNGDRDKHLVIKMDVEGAEWDTFLQSPDSLFERIDQLAVEFHGSGDEKFTRAIQRLKRFFYVANLHFNNYSCDEKYAPLPSWAYEVLLVNKRLAQPDRSGAPVVESALNAPNNPSVPDCQAMR
jgi:hypothetical protein